MQARYDGKKDDLIFPTDMKQRKYKESSSSSESSSTVDTYNPIPDGYPLCCRAAGLSTRVDSIKIFAGRLHSGRSEQCTKRANI